MSRRTDTPTLPPPPGPFGERDTDVVGQGITVPAAWWRSVLPDDDVPARLRADTPTAVLTRADVWALGDEAVTSPAGARRLLWASLAWGAGRHVRNCRRRVTSVLTDPEAAGAVLQEAARLSREDPVAAYETLHPGRGQSVRYLGPAFGTKHLYFAGGGVLDHPSLILDTRVATSLRRLGWTTLPTTGWSPAAYGRYVELLARWAQEIGDVSADQVERVLFERGR